METLDFNMLLLKTAFSCMACDGDIDKREISLIEQLHRSKKIFGEIDIKVELENFRIAINMDGKQFIKSFFNDLKTSQLNESKELSLIEVAIKTIEADTKIEYSEVKFFKVIRSFLKVNNERILSALPNLDDYLEDDIITESYLSNLQNDFFDTHKSIQFETLNILNENSLDNLSSTK
ncbi:TerB family tellurite resistance protein [Crocinitomicaceae bacterium]|jgi:uncharacterized tellurite resistance protein B-like protein|nr:TerB family tellurite resistance protein [Crocinitomicaceae bacterium]